jgi:carboxylate-amine ligase
MSTPSRLHLFEAYGVELEYMIVDRETLNVRPIADQLLEALAGSIVSEIEVNGASWSNELILHVIELKCSHPVTSLESLPDLFQGEVQRVNKLLEPLGAMLLPSAMHPWMDPVRESRLWPHEYHEIYETYHRIFNCFRHGWANLQSVHLNLPFFDEEEFARLHAAIRVLLPILPGIAASSPLCDGRPSGMMDTRMEVYRTNSQRIPSITGQVIPEPIFEIDLYREQILERALRDTAPFDHEGVLQGEFLNARGAIARFDRGAIEIRVLDVQECPRVDVAICGAVTWVLQQLVAENWSDLATQQTWQVEPLYDILLNCVQEADRATIVNRDYLNLFGYRGSSPATAQQLWNHLMDEARRQDAPFIRHWDQSLGVLVDSSPLARRILQHIGPDFTRERLESTYRTLANCLQSGKMLE